MRIIKTYQDRKANLKKYYKIFAKKLYNNHNQLINTLDTYHFKLNVNNKVINFILDIHSNMTYYVASLHKYGYTNRIRKPGNCKTYDHKFNIDLLYIHKKIMFVSDKYALYTIKGKYIKELNDIINKDIIEFNDMLFASNDNIFHIADASIVDSKVNKFNRYKISPFAKIVALNIRSNLGYYFVPIISFKNLYYRIDKHATKIVVKNNIYFTNFKLSL